MTHTLVLFSGGKDSAVAFFWALREYDKVTALSIDYPGRPNQEKMAAEVIVADTRADLLSATLPFMFSSEQGYTGAEQRPAITSKESAYIPMRNLLFYAVAGYYAEILQIESIILGNYRGEGITYPDASQGFLRQMETVFSLSMSRKYLGSCDRLLLNTPLLELDEYEVALLGKELGVPFPLTWSCWRDLESPCMQCYSCEERERVFLKSGINA
jgi:7-cyano-7-deazaguanine synthase